MAEDHPSVDHFRLWLRAGLTGCHFATNLAFGEGRLALEAQLEPLDASNFDSNFHRYGRANRATVIVLPSIKSEADLVRLLLGLPAQSERWKLTRRKKDHLPGVVCVGLEWTTESKHVSEVMGFAPFMTMPVPRRAPYVAIGLWPGAPANPHRELDGLENNPKPKEGRVSFLDSHLAIDPDTCRTRWDATRNAVASLMENPIEFVRSAFVLPRSFQEELFPSAPPPVPVTTIRES